MKCDERGWRIPRDGTQARAIYEGLLQKRKPNEMAQELGVSHIQVNVTIWRIKNPIEDNYRRKLGKYRQWQREHGQS